MTWAKSMQDHTDQQGHKRNGSVAYGQVSSLVGLSEMEIALQYEELQKELSNTSPVVGQLKDSGQRELYITGAVRDNGESKGRFDLISTQALLRLSRHYEAGAKKYSDRNWEKGMPIGRMVSAAMRHLVKYMAGANDEDHLAAVLWNVAAIMHYEYYKPELQDLPTWEGRRSRFMYEIDLGGDDD